MPATEEQPMTLRLPADWHEFLRRKAFSERTTKTKLIRDALAATYDLKEADYPQAGSSASAHADRTTDASG